MHSWLTGCEQTTSTELATTTTDLATAASDENDDDTNTRLEEIERKHRKVLKEYDEKIKEIGEQISVCDQEFSRIEADNDNVNNIMLRHERHVNEQIARQNNRITTLAELVSHLTPKS